MDNALGTLGYGLTLDANQFDRRLAEIENKYKNFTQSGIAQTSALEKSLSRVTQLAAGYFTLQGAQSLVSDLVKVRGEYQQLGNSLEVMLRSKAKGDKLLADATQFAATTPFTLQQVGAGTKQLIAYGSQADNVINELRMLGDVAAGVGSDIQDLTYLYGTLRTQGKAMAVDIRQFASRGIPIYQELAKVMKVNVSEISSLVEKGKVGFPQVEQAFKNMTAQGGQFGGLMEKNSKTLTGLLSNMSDAYSQMMNKIGASQEGVLADGIKGITAMMQNYEPYLKLLTGVVAVYGTYRTALMAVNVAQTLIKTSAAATLYIEMTRQLGTLTAATYVQATALGVQTRAQAMLNAVTSANPYVAVITIVAGLAAVLWTLSDNTSRAEKAQTLLNDASIKSQKAIDDQKKKTGELSFEEEKRIKILQTSLILETELAALRSSEKLKTINDTNNGIGLGIGATNFAKSNTNNEYLQHAENVRQLKRKLRQLSLETEIKPSGTGGGTGGDKTLKKGNGDAEWRAELEKDAVAIEKLIKKLRELNGQNLSFYEMTSRANDDKVEKIISHVNLEKGAKERLNTIETSMMEVTEKNRQIHHENELERLEKEKQASEAKFRLQLDLGMQVAELLGGVAGRYGGGVANIANTIKMGGNVGFPLASLGLNVAGDIVNQIKKQRADKESYYRSVIKYQQEYNLALNDQLALENRSVLIGNIKGQYAGQFSKADDARKKLESLINQLKNGSNIQIFDKGDGVFGNKPVIELIQISKMFPGLINADGTINEAKANAILKAGNIPIASEVGKQQIKDLIQSTLDWNKQLEDAKKAIDDLTNSIAGNLGNSLQDALVNAFKTGGDAAQVFGNEVEKVLEQISSQILFQAVFKSSFEELSDSIKQSFGISGDGTLTDDFGKFLSNSPQLIAQYNAGLSALQQQGLANGLNLFGSGSSVSNDQLSGSIKGVSEQTAGVVAGQMNAMRITQSLIHNTLMQSMDYHRQTAENTLAIKNLMNSNSLRANGVI